MAVPSFGNSAMDGYAVAGCGPWIVAGRGRVTWRVRCTAATRSRSRPARPCRAVQTPCCRGTRRGRGRVSDGRRGAGSTRPAGRRELPRVRRWRGRGAACRQREQRRTV
ncbi:hypothetical protein [Saccharothrix luteola]|uniref:hypothetical protein n=1 Tax=Saccharothrix luteola TaxID=2893018 RepID=UPI0035590C1E